jgi:hypothetical protein
VTFFHGGRKRGNRDHADVKHRSEALNEQPYYSNNWIYDDTVLAWKTVADGVTPGSSAVVVT